MDKISARPYMEYDKIIGHRYLPDMVVRILHENGGYFLKTNNMGFRSDFNFEKKKAHRNVVRILLFGDSFTAGDGVSNNQRYSDILSKRFEDVEIYNFGLSHSGTDQQYLIFKECVKDMEFDFIMICPLVENIKRNVATSLPCLSHDGDFFMRPKPFFTLNDSMLVVNNVPVPRVNLFDKHNGSGIEVQNTNHASASLINKIRLWAAFRLKKMLFMLFRQQTSLYSEYDSSTTREWVLQRAILENWAKEIYPKKTFIVPIPWHLYIEDDMYSPANYSTRFAELGSVHSITVFNPLKALKSHSMDEIMKFTYAIDKHFTEAGHKALADAIFPILSDMVRNLRKSI